MRVLLKPLLYVMALQGALAGVACAEVLSIPEIFRLASQNNPNVLQAKSRMAAAASELETAKYSRLPTLSTDARTPTPNATQSATRIDQPLWTGGRITGQIQAAEANQTASQYGVLETEVGVLTELSGSAFDFLRFSEKLLIADTNIADHQRLVDLIDRRVKNEISPAADLVLANSRLQQALSDKIQLNRQLESARLSITRWVGRNLTAIKRPSRITFKQMPLLDWVSKAMDYSPQRKRLASQIDSAGFQVDIAGSAAYPTLSVGYQHYWGDQLPFGYDRNQVYLNLQYQPGAGLSTMSRKQAAIQQQEAARQELANLELALAAEVRSTYSDIQSFEGLSGPARKLLDGNAEVVDSYIRQYQVGRRNWLEVLNALREKNQAAYSVVDIEMSSLSSQVKLMLLAGEITSQNIVAIHE